MVPAKKARPRSKHALPADLVDLTEDCFLPRSSDGLGACTLCRNVAPSRTWCDYCLCPFGPCCVYRNWVRCLTCAINVRQHNSDLSVEQLLFDYELERRLVRSELHRPPLTVQQIDYVRDHCTVGRASQLPSELFFRMFAIPPEFRCELCHTLPIWFQCSACHLRTCPECTYENEKSRVPACSRCINLVPQCHVCNDHLGTRTCSACSKNVCRRCSERVVASIVCELCTQQASGLSRPSSSKSLAH